MRFCKRFLQIVYSKKVIKILISIIFLFASYSSYAVFVPFEWDRTESADYYILEFTNDPSFSDILIVHTPKKNNITLEIKPGTYYFKVTPIINKSTNPKPSQILVIKVDSKGFVANSGVKNKYPNTKNNINAFKVITINMKAKPVFIKRRNYIPLNGKMTHKACWDQKNRMWVSCY